ncbi:hypothetical protein BS78_09G128700 [Paspalum vaginatum]|nr:hypothetical protein BS78_09G128700 [Paspalum vaginatum]
MASTPPPFRTPPPSPPALMEELIEEILLRLPPEEPVYLIRAALVCKAWRRILSDSSRGGFLRRYREFHGAPPLLGYVHNAHHHPRLDSTTTTASPPLSMPEASDEDMRWVLDCRHGRVLIMDDIYSPSIRFIIWDPITRDRKHVKVPDYYPYSSHAAAVLCAMDGCDHLHCNGGPFHVVLVEKRDVSGEEHVAWARIYSSETDAWSAASASIVVCFPINSLRSLLVRGALYFTFSDWGTTPSIIMYDLSSNGLSMIDASGVPIGAIAMKAHDGSLGFVATDTEFEWNCRYLILMSQQAAGGWARHKTVELEPTLLAKKPRELFGYADGTDTVFISTDAGVFTLHLKSRLVKKVAERYDCYRVLPYTSFFTPELAKARRLRQR